MTLDTTFAGFRLRLYDFIHSSVCEAATAPAQLSHQKNEFNSLALALFRLQVEHNLPYRKFSESRRIIPSEVSRWNDIPEVPTAAFKDLKLTCLPSNQRTNIFHSSGTTEHRPSRHFHNATSLALYETSAWIWFARNVLMDAVPRDLLILAPPPAQAPHSSLVHMFETIRRKMRAEPSAFVGATQSDGSWSLKFDVAVSLLRSETPLLILGTAFSFVHLLDHLASKNLSFQLPHGSRVMETGGYKDRSRSMPKRELHGLITQYLGVPQENTICEYGMSELSSQAYNTGARTSVRSKQQTERGPEKYRNSSTNSELLRTEVPAPAFQFPPWAHAQIISAETGQEVSVGETGLIRVFDLANVYSVMAIQTEDLAIRCDEGFELIGRAELAEPRGCSLMARND